MVHGKQRTCDCPPFNQQHTRWLVVKGGVEIMVSVVWALAAWLFVESVETVRCAKGPAGEGHRLLHWLANGEAIRLREVKGCRPCGAPSCSIVAMPCALTYILGTVAGSVPCITWRNSVHIPCRVASLGAAIR